MGSRRFRPLILCVLALAAVVLLRLFRLQVLEHELWAGEATNLVRSSTVVPYRRGSIVDRAGREIVRDEEVYRVEFRYRDFRRGHPLGALAHAWSSLELRAVPLDEALAVLAPAALELVQLSHAELDAFAAGEALSGEHMAAAAALPGRQEYRFARRADLRFYISRLLRLDRRESLDAVRSKERYPSILAFALAAHPEFESEAELLDDLARRLAEAERDLGRLADLLHGGDRAALIADLEAWRREVEDASASELFREAAGFSMGRLEPSTVVQYFDLDWLAVLLRWDQARLAQWIEGARADWTRAFAEYHLPRLGVLLELGRQDELAGIVSGFWAERYLRDGGAVAEGADHALEVLDDLDSLFEVRRPRDLSADDLCVPPFGEPGVRFGAGASWEDLARLELWALSGAEPAAAEVAALAAEWSERNARELDQAWIAERTAAVVASLEPRLQGALAGFLAELTAAESGRRLPLSDGRLDHAEERAQSVQKDHGSRPFDLGDLGDLGGEPDYTLVHLVTRYPEAFAGFGVSQATRRYRQVYRRGANDVAYAAALVGNVRAPGLIELLGQRAREAELALLLRRGERDEEQISTLVREILLVDEQLGSEGLEGQFEDELSGANGYREVRGMQELLDAAGGAGGGRPGRDYFRPPEDGRELLLTLDLELQRAAQETLAHPAEDPDPSQRDYRWLARPTGAIILARPDGDVLAAASFPDAWRTDAATGEPSSDPRDWAIDRTLTAVDFQPPGSVIKPFVAVWALDRAGLDPTETMTCGARDGGRGAGYRSMACSNLGGHGGVELHEALMRSCNGYFAWLGEQLDEHAFQSLAAAFGFGQPTGVRCYPERGGLREDVCSRHLFENLQGSRLLMAGNGLGVVNVTPMQVARAYAGLATGELPEMRLVERVGDEPLPRRSRPIDFSEQALEIVRAGLFDVAAIPGGTAHVALDADELGFALCVKTGSADLSSVAVVTADGTERVPKHTWVAGWFPPEKPVAVLVVFVDDTLATASHSAVWIARQFLQRPEVQAFARAELGE